MPDDSNRTGTVLPFTGKRVREPVAPPRMRPPRADEEAYSDREPLDHSDVWGFAEIAYRLACRHNAFTRAAIEGCARYVDTMHRTIAASPPEALTREGLLNMCLECARQIRVLNEAPPETDGPAPPADGAA